MRRKIATYAFQTVAIAILYALVTILQDRIFGFAKGPGIQARMAEALTILPVFTGAAIPGLFIGCLIANYVVLVLFQAGPVPLEPLYWDIICGSLATMIGAIGTYLIRNRIGKNKYLASVPPIIINVAVLPLLFFYKFHGDETFLFLVGSIGVGELLACGIFGTALLLVLDDYKDRLFPTLSASEETDPSGDTEEDTE